MAGGLGAEWRGKGAASRDVAARGHTRSLSIRVPNLPHRAGVAAWAVRQGGGVTSGRAGPYVRVGRPPWRWANLLRRCCRLRPPITTPRPHPPGRLPPQANPPRSLRLISTKIPWRARPRRHHLGTDPRGGAESSSQRLSVDERVRCQGSLAMPRRSTQRDPTSVWLVGLERRISALAATAPGTPSNHGHRMFLTPPPSGIPLSCTSVAA